MDILLFLKANEMRQVRLGLCCRERRVELVLVEIQDSRLTSRVPACDVPGKIEADGRSGLSVFSQVRFAPQSQLQAVSNQGVPPDTNGYVPDVRFPKTQPNTSDRADAVFDVAPPPCCQCPRGSISSVSLQFTIPHGQSRDFRSDQCADWSDVCICIQDQATVRNVQRFTMRSCQEPGKRIDGPADPAQLQAL